MEDTLRVVVFMLLNNLTFSLNPCFNGRYSQGFDNSKTYKIGFY